MAYETRQSAFVHRDKVLSEVFVAELILKGDDEVDLCSDIYRSIGMDVYECWTFGDLFSGVTGKALALHEEAKSLLFGLLKDQFHLLPFLAHSTFSNFS